MGWVFYVVYIKYTVLCWMIDSYSTWKIMICYMTSRTDFGVAVHVWIISEWKGKYICLLCVIPILLYGSGVWGLKQFKCCEDIILRACRYFMGIHRLAPIPHPWSSVLPICRKGRKRRKLIKSPRKTQKMQKMQKTSAKKCGKHRQPVPLL